MRIAIDHVNVTVPVGATDELVAFYEAAFGFTRVEKPAGGRRPGAWIRFRHSNRVKRADVAGSS